MLKNQMNEFSHQARKLSPFIFSKKKLFQFQKKIQYLKNQPRFCRHFQRLLRRTSFIQFLMIRQILQIQLKEIHKKQPKSPLLQKIQLSKQFLQSKKYCSFLNTQITYKLWILSLVPLIETEKRLRTFLTGKKNFQIYSTLHRFLKTSFIQYIMIYQISNFWSSKNKLWILSNVLIEKKFFINWLKNEKKISRFQFSNHRDYVRLKTLIQYFSIINIHHFIRENKLRYAQLQTRSELKPTATANASRLRARKASLATFGPPLTLTKASLKQKEKKLFVKKTFLNSELNKFSILKEKDIFKIDRSSFEFIEYNHFLFFPLTNETKNQWSFSFQKILSHLAKFHGLSLQFAKLYPISNGVDFLGWHFKKELSYFHTVVSHANVRSHQKELKKYLKTSYPKQPDDQIVYGLNKKIKTWKKFYGSRLAGAERSEARVAACHVDRKGLVKQISFSDLQLNDYLFWRIWHWIQKRHRNKSSKWLYSRYWKKSTSNHQWIFSINNTSLISYRLIKSYDF